MSILEKIKCKAERLISEAKEKIGNRGKATGTVHDEKEEPGGNSK